VQPVAALQSEYSIWWRAIEENGVLPTCEELRHRLGALQPAGPRLPDRQDRCRARPLPANDIRSRNPRFTQEAIKANQGVIDLLARIGGEKGATPAQIALAWLLAQKPWIVPIPGSRRLERLDENNGAVNVALAPADLGAIAEAMAAITVVGDRY
jgi:aryl-alcohol dehydrogenase-like predicted oxidoreductase